MLRAADAPAQLARRLASAEVLQQAQAERLTLLVAKNKGFFCVHLAQPGCLKPWLARVWRGGKTVHLGMFATAEEAALCVARSPEGQAAPLQLLQLLSAHAAAKTARFHARAPSWLPHGGRPERRNSEIDDDAEVEVDEATAMVTIEVLDAVAVHEDDAHHHEAVVVEADLVSESRKQPFFVIR